MFILPHETYIKDYNVEIFTITTMAIYSDITTLINKLNDGDKCWSFSNMEIGTCFTVLFRDMQSNKVNIKVRGETMTKTFSLPTQLRKIITTDIFEKVKEDGMILL